MRSIVILGSTGSIGTQTLEIIKEYKDINVLGLACKSNVSLLKKQIEEFNPKYVYTQKRNKELESMYPNITFFFGSSGLIKLTSLEEDYEVLNSLVGSAGFYPTINAIKHHKKVLLANKETLVIGGEIVKKYLKRYNETLYPIDSEHSSLWELLDEYNDNVDEITITASGGPFFDYKIEDLENVSKEMALAHPNWKMGPKITIDSSTMMNKTFELIEAYYLFDYPIDKIHAVVNRKSMVHSYVTLKDGSIKYRASIPSMRDPIIRALYYPEIRYPMRHMEGNYIFEKIDENKFPSINLGIKALKMGGLYPTVLNAANESAVYLFLNDEIKYTDIYKIVNKALDYFKVDEALSIKNILKYDKIVKDWVIKTYGRGER